MGVLYKLTGPTGKAYIGITSKTLAQRWLQHRRNASKGRGDDDDCPGLYSALRKYGHEQFSVETLAVAASWGGLCAMEREAIDRLKTYAPGGYNLTRGGDGALGNVPTPKARERMAAAQLRASAETKQKRLIALPKAVMVRAANWHAKTDAQRAAWCEQHGVVLRQAWSDPLVRKAQSERQTKAWADEARRARQSISLTGRKMPPKSEEWKAAMAERRRLEWADPVMRAKRVDGMRRAAAEKAAR